MELFLKLYFLSPYLTLKSQPDIRITLSVAAGEHIKKNIFFEEELQWRLMGNWWFVFITSFVPLIWCGIIKVNIFSFRGMSECRFYKQQMSQGFSKEIMWRCKVSHNF